MNRSFQILTLTAALATNSHAQITRIIQTGDPIPGSPGLTAGTVFHHAEIDAGHAAFMTDHIQFGVTVPSNTILYWDGSTLAKVADDDTPVPGLPGRKILLNDITDPDTLSFDVHHDPAVIFWASYEAAFGQDYALYRWRPGTGLETYVAPDASLSYIRPAIIRAGALAVRSLPGLGDPADDGLTLIASNGTRSKLLSPDDPLPDFPNRTFDHVFDDFFFNGIRTVARVNTSLPSRSGWYEFRPNGSSNPLLLTGDDATTNDYSYNTISIHAIDESSNPTGSALALGRGTRGGNPSEALLVQSNPGAGFGVLYQRGDPTPGAVGYSYFRFTEFNIRSGTIVFSATSYSGENELNGIYLVEPQGVTTLIDTRGSLDGKNIAGLTLHHRDVVTGDVLFTAHFDNDTPNIFHDDTAGLYTTTAGLNTLTFGTWTSDQFPGANGDPDIVGLLADPDRDRVPNLAEFALGGAGNLPDPNKTTPTPSPTGDFTYTRRTTLPDTVTVTPQIAASLHGPWLSGPTVLEEISTTPDPSDPALTTVHLRSLLPATTTYFRLVVSSTE